MSTIPGPTTHPPGAYHPFDPINCSSDAGWQQQLMQQAAMAHHRVTQQAQAHSEAARQAVGRQAEDDLLLLRR